MKLRHAWRLSLLAALAVMGTGCGLGRALAPPGPQGGPADVRAGVQVLTRGPVHEAFAETVTFDPEPGIVVPKAPPAAIEEVPPGHRPDGAHVAWIPGYWAWDDERSDFLWVSGTWRAMPPGHQWVPGYWASTGPGYQWTSGYWADAQASEAEYLPEPPATVEAGPTMAAPSPDRIWIPGCWVRHQGRFAWRPGYWAAGRPDWVWIPAHYVWARRGYVFVEGYWDYPLDRRGVLFAPASFDAGVYGQDGFTYSPSTVIDLGALADNLFLRPSYGHYYFGDYYAANYDDAGFYSPYSFYSGNYGYDPFYAHQRWEHRGDAGWERGVQAAYRQRRDHEDARPPRTLAAQAQLLSRSAKSNVPVPVMAVPLAHLAKSAAGPIQLRPLAPQERQALGQHVQAVQNFRAERVKLETAAGTPPKISEPVRVTLPRSPIVAPAVFDQHLAPPARHQPPAPDLRVQPNPRGTGGGGKHH